MRVTDLGGKRTAVIAVAIVLALLAHGTAAARVYLFALRLSQQAGEVPVTYEIEVTKPKEPEPPPVEEKKPEEPKEVPKAAPPPPAPKDAPPPPPPAAAQAAAVLTQKPDDEPVDFTNSFVSGSSATFAGGITQAGGTSAQAVYNRAATAQGVPGGTGTAPAPPAPPGPDRSRGLSVSSKDWSCGDLFPAEADSEQIDEMLVPVEVSVGADGKVQSVRVLKDPGHGFGRAAVQCTNRQGKDSFNLALDHDGNPIPGKHAINVRFTR